MSQRPATPASDPNADFAPLGFHKAAGGGGRSIDIVRFVLSIWKRLAVGMAAGLALGVLVYLYKGPVYRASTRVQVSKKASLPINSQEARRYTDRSQHIHFLMSDTIAAIALEKYGLKEIPGIGGAYDPLKSIWEDTSAKLVSGQDSSYDAIIEVAYENPNKEIAKKVVDAIVKAYEDWLVQTRDKNSSDLYENLQQSRKGLQTDIAKLERDWRSWRESSKYFYPTPPVVTVNGMPAPTVSPHVQALQSVIKDQEQLEAQRANVQGKIATLKKMIASQESRDEIQFWVMHALSSGTGGGGAEGGGGGGGGAASILAGPSGKADLDSRLLTARLLENRLQQLVGDDHADLKNVRGQIKTILDAYRSQGMVPPDLEKEAAAANSKGPKATTGVDLPSVYLYILESQLEEFKIRDGLLATRRSDAEKNAKEASLFDADDQNRKDDIALKKKELEGVQRQVADYIQSRSQEGYQVNRVSQIRLERSMKQILKILGACGILGLAGVFALSYFLEWYDTSLRNVDEVREVSGATVMATVPHFRDTAVSPAMAHTGISSQVLYLHRPGSREAEAYRSLRTTLFFSTRESREKVIQVSSSEPGDGKSTTTANLAVAMAQSGKRVLLIDADLRRPTVHELFGLPQHVGLSDLLVGTMPLETTLKETPVANLTILTAGIAPENPAELLSSPRLPEILTALRSQFDWILVDCPPILAVSDPCVVAPYADGMLLVVRLLKNKRAVLQRAREVLDAHGIRILGVIANDMGSSAEDADLYGRYDEYYHAPTAEAAVPKVASVPPRTASAAGKTW